MSARAHYEAGRVLLQYPVSAPWDAQMRALARVHFLRAGDVDPHFKLGWLGLIQLDCMAGKTPDESVRELSYRLRETPLGPADRGVLFSLKDMSIARTLCLDRHDVERIFAAAHANRTATPYVRAMLHSWLADYLALRVRDLVAAQAELDRSLALEPYNPSNRLKRAQLAYLQGRRDQTLAMLDELRGARLTTAEKETMAELRRCLQSAGRDVECRSN